MDGAAIAPQVSTGSVGRAAAGAWSNILHAMDGAAIAPQVSTGSVGRAAAGAWSRILPAMDGAAIAPQVSTGSVGRAAAGACAVRVMRATLAYDSSRPPNLAALTL